MSTAGGINASAVSWPGEDGEGGDRELDPDRWLHGGGSATTGDAEARAASVVAQMLRACREQLAQRWAEEALLRTVYRDGRESAMRAARTLVDGLQEAAAEGRVADPQARGFDRLRPLVTEILTSRSAAGASLAQVQTEAAALRVWMVSMLEDWVGTAHDHGRQTARLSDPAAGPDTGPVTGSGGGTVIAIGPVVAATELMGTFRLVLTEVAAAEDSGVIARQRQELLEIATPVLRVWQGVLAVPVIGTLDSARSQVMMEALLEGIVEQRAAVAILDITGVPMVDTVVAQHLMNTATAVGLMGATCVISGIRPQIAQTIAALGIDLGTIRTQASLADALNWALTHLSSTKSG